jgi:hypothetical protein
MRLVWFVSFETIIQLKGIICDLKLIFNNWFFEVWVILFIEFHRVTTINFLNIKFPYYQFEHYLCFKGIKLLLLVTFNIIIIIKIWKKNFKKTIVKALVKRNALLCICSNCILFLTHSNFQVILGLGGVLRPRWGPRKRFLFIYLFIFLFSSLLLVCYFPKVGEIFSN